MGNKVITALNNSFLNILLRTRYSQLCDVIMNNISSQEEVLDVVKRLKPDVIVVDDRLRGTMEWDRFIEELVRLSGSSRVVLVTSCASAEYARDMVKLGICGIFVEGEAEISQLISLILRGDADRDGKTCTKGGRWKSPEEIPGVEYVIPEGCKPVAGFTGAGRTGKTFLANMVALNISKKGRKVALMDMTRNRTLYGYYCWGRDGQDDRKRALEHLCKGVNNPFMVNASMMLYTSPGIPAEEMDLSGMLETVLAGADVVIFDMDMHVRPVVYKHMNSFFLVQDMDYYNIIDNTVLLKRLKDEGVNLKKAGIVLNRFVECAVEMCDVKRWISIVQGYDSKEESLLSDDTDVFKVRFSMQDYITGAQNGFDRSSSLHGFTCELLRDIDAISRSICPGTGRAGNKRCRKSPERRF